jgi:peptidoglycan hydrolase CwlO-like protein
VTAAWIAVIGAVVSALISGAFGYAIKRSSDRAVRGISRDEIEAEAFQRAQSYYTGVIDRQDGEIEELRGEVRQVRGDLDTEQRARRQLATKVRHLEETLAERDQLIEILQNRS